MIQSEIWNITVGSVLLLVKTALHTSALFRRAEIGVTFRNLCEKRQWAALMALAAEKLVFTGDCLIVSRPQHWLLSRYKKQP